MKTSGTCLWVAFLFLAAFGGNGLLFSQPKHFGIYAVDLPAGWTAVQESPTHFSFQHNSSGLTVNLFKSPDNCADAASFNKLIMGKIQELTRNQEVVEMRKPTFPCQILGQKGCHLMLVKSKETDARHLLLHVKAGEHLYQIDVQGNISTAELPQPAREFLGQLGLADGSIMPLASKGKENADAVFAQDLKTDQSGTTRAARDASLSGQTKVKSETDVQTIGASTSISGMTSTAVSGSAFDAVAAEKAAGMPDGDEMPYVVFPSGTPQPVAADAGWALSLAHNPGQLIDALSGDRPGGEVSAMIALLRQAMGPFDEQEEQAVYNQYAAHASVGSPKTRKAIRGQSELLLQALIHRQLMMQAAHEYDFALSQMQVAEAMQDEEELLVASLMLQTQQMIAETQQQAVDRIVKKSEASTPVPTAAEVIAEHEEKLRMAENATYAVFQATASIGGQAGGPGGTVDSDAADVARYHALRQEHRMLVETMGGSSPEATAIYREAMDLRRKLEAKGIDVFNYKSPVQPTDVQNTPVADEPFIIPSNPDPRLSPEQNQAIAEHEQNINSAIRMMNAYKREMAQAKTPEQREELRLLALHMAQNIHDSKDLIASIRTGTIVKTRGPWDEHAAVVLAETSRKLREDFQRASQMQASYARMLNILNKYNPQEAARFREKMADNVIKGIFDPGGFEKAQQALNSLHAITKTTAQGEQRKLEAEQTRSFERLETIERHLAYAETIKSGCDKAIFVGTLFTGMAPGLLLSMAYEGACTAAEKGPEAALKSMAYQGAITLSMMGVMKAGGWALGKLTNPKVARSEINTFKNILENNRLAQETEWNQALVNQFKERARAFNAAKASGGKNYLEARKALDEAVAACNSSSLAKRLMKNELNMIENQIRTGATRDFSKLREVASYHRTFENRLQRSIYPRTDAEMINKLRAQGYNVEASWFQEFRNASSRGINADRDLGLLAKFERSVMKNGQPVSMSQFMDEAQKAYDASYKAITGRSARLADQNITTSVHGESFPVSWLKKKMEGPFSTLDPPVTPSDFQKAGKAIYAKVENAMSGPDPAFVNMKKACASLSKDLKTKVFERLQSPPPGTGLTPTARQAALEHWSEVQKVLEKFATDQSDPFTTMKKLQELTGTTSITENARKLQQLMGKLGG
ncbi:MAG: hypothetical protein IPM52_07645 [Bacteroidetes bacterium]|nr:hypothetical protein [Bacteroidota bacterium]